MNTLYNNIKLLVAIGFISLASSCIKPDPEKLVLTYTQMDFESEAQSQSFNISSNFVWDIEISDSWLSVSPVRGFGDKVLTVSVQANTQLTQRTASFFIVGEETRQEVQVIQKGEAPALALDATQKRVRALGDTMSVGIATNLELDVTTDASWIQFVGTKTVTTQRYQFTVGQNTSLEERSAKVLFKQKNGSLSAELTVLQSGEALAISVNTKAVSMKAEGGEASVEVTSNIPWTVSASETWVHPITTKLMETNACSFTIDPNTWVDARNAVLTIKAKDNEELAPVTINIAQEGAIPSATFTPSVLDTLPAATSTAHVAVEANFLWSVDSTYTAKWVSHISIKNGSIYFDVAENEDIKDRVTTLSVQQTGGTYTKPIAIVQRAGAQQIILPEQSSVASIPATGGVLEIPVNANIAWKASVSADWLSVVETVATKGMETSVLTLSATSHTDITERKAMVMVASEDNTIKKFMQITQVGAAPYIKVSPDTLQVSAAAQEYMVNVASNVELILKSLPAWVSGVTTTPSGSQGVEARVSVLANTTTEERVGKIEWVARNSTLSGSLMLIQAGEQVFVNAALSTSAYLENVGDSFTLTVESNIATQVKFSETVAWITQLSKIEQGRTTTYTFKAAPVLTQEVRSAVLQVKDAAGETLYKSFTILQKGARIAKSDSLILVAFHQKTNGENWRDSKYWNMQLPANQWPGVTLGTAVRSGELRVVKLELSNARLNSLSGIGDVILLGQVTSKDLLSGLTYLEVLDLSENSMLFGTLPISWSELAYLQKLDVSNCNLTNYKLLSDYEHNLPKEYGAYSLSGSTKIFKLPDLKVFKAKGNLFTGSIPEELTEHPYFNEWDFATQIAPQKSGNLILPVVEEPSTGE